MPQIRRKVEMPRLTWLEDRENDLRLVKVKRLSQNMNSREEQALIVMEAKAFKEGQRLST
jgi:radical SAM superfamily enzyme YgiQ (UPF0313 family)